jgi:hypothetical protein
MLSRSPLRHAGPWPEVAPYLSHPPGSVARVSDEYDEPETDDEFSDDVDDDELDDDQAIADEIDTDSGDDDDDLGDLDDVIEVDPAVRARLDDIAASPLSEHAEAYQQMHTELQQALADIEAS